MHAPASVCAYGVHYESETLKGADLRAPCNESEQRAEWIAVCAVEKAWLIDNTAAGEWAHGAHGTARNFPFLQPKPLIAAIIIMTRGYNLLGAFTNKESKQKTHTQYREKLNTLAQYAMSKWSFWLIFLSLFDKFIFSVVKMKRHSFIIVRISDVRPSNYYNNINFACWCVIKNIILKMSCSI